jgi:hypothetical protein
MVAKKALEQQAMMQKQLIIKMQSMHKENKELKAENALLKEAAQRKGVKCKDGQTQTCVEM